jgi:midasin
LWKNGHSFWNTHLYDDNLKSLINGEILPIVYNEVTINIENLPSTIQLPLVSGQSGIIFSMLRKMENVPLYSVESKLQQLRNLLQTASYDSQNIDDLWSLDTDILKFSLVEFFQSQLSHIGNDEYQRSKEAILSCTPDQIHCLDLFISSVSDRLWMPATKYFLQKCLLSLQSIHHGKSVLQERGIAWICYSIMFVQTYIPEFPFDPVDSRKAKILFLEKVFDSVSASMLVDFENEYLAKGSFDFNNSVEKQNQLSSIATKLKKWKSKMPLRPELSQIFTLFSELNKLKVHILEGSKIQKLISDLTSKSITVYETALQEVLTMQHNLDSILHLWNLTFPYYKDLLDPIYTAIYQLKFGLCLIRSEAINSKSTTAIQTADFLTDFMSFIDEKEILLPTKESLTLLDLDIRLSVIKRIWFEYETTSNPQYIPTLMNLLTDIANDWADAEEKKKKTVLESESIYKTKEVHIETQDEYDEKRFKELFPDYAEDFEDLESEAKDEEIHESPFKNELTIYSGKKAMEILSIFHSICTSVNSIEGESFTGSTKSIWPDIYADCFNIGVSVLESYKVIPSSDMDVKLKTGFIFMNQMRIKSIDSPLDQGKDVYDFYNDPNIYESRRIGPVILQYEKKLNMALEKWPEHDVLISLATICKRLISFPVTSPILKLLLGLELLLIKSHDWEAYSSKEYSLKQEMDNLIKIIVSWRKLELETWRDLLEIESRKGSEAVSSQWYHLWKVVICALQAEIEVY